MSGFGWLRGLWGGGAPADVAPDLDLSTAPRALIEDAWERALSEHERLRAAHPDDASVLASSKLPHYLDAMVHALAREAREAAAGLAAQLKQLASVLGVLQLEPEAFLQAGAAGKVAVAALALQLELEDVLLEGEPVQQAIRRPSAGLQQATKR
jgi:hypothetical protein